jgi:hypothetical protein
MLSTNDISAFQLPYLGSWRWKPMSEETENLVLAILKDILLRMSRMEERMTKLELRMTIQEQHLGMLLVS